MVWWWKALFLVPLMLAAMGGTAMADRRIGVTAAVNPSVFGTPAGSPARTLALGNEVYHNERITAEADGLLQVLFIDGTTITIGPGTDLVIDRYVFDPDKGTGELAATMAKGVLRFVGGKLSKKSDAVKLNAISGTMGSVGHFVLDAPCCGMWLRCHQAPAGSKGAWASLKDADRRLTS